MSAMSGPEQTTTRWFRFHLFSAALLGFLLAPTVGGAVGTAAWYFVSASGQASSFGDAVGDGVFLGLRYGFPLAIAIGWPLHLLLMWTRVARAIVYVALGCALALLPVAIYALLGGEMLARHPSMFAEESLSLALAGAIGGLVFWLIRRPDLDTRSNEPSKPSLDANAKPLDLSPP